MKITFDSNVWRIIATPDNFLNEPSINDFRAIRKGIKDGKIDPYISETVFTIEAIKRTERKKVIGNKRAKIDTKEDAQDSGFIGMTFTIGPSKGLNFDNNPILKAHFDDAVNIGFKITRLPRIAGFTNEEVEKVRFNLSGDALKNYLDKVFEVESKIEANGAGISHIKKIGENYDKIWFNGIKSAPEHEKGNIAKAAAEWADGDSVAVCIALGCDYFCTRDQAQAAGMQSVLSSQNLTWLKNDYGFEIVSPENLATIINQDELI